MIVKKWSQTYARLHGLIKEGGNVESCCESYHWTDWTFWVGTLCVACSNMLSYENHPLMDLKSME